MVVCVLINSISANHNNSRGHRNHYNDSKFKIPEEETFPTSTSMLCLKSVIPEEKRVQVDSFHRHTLGTMLREAVDLVSNSALKNLKHVRSNIWNFATLGGQNYQYIYNQNHKTFRIGITQAEHLSVHYKLLSVQNVRE